MILVWLLLAFIAGTVSLGGFLIYADYRKWAGASLKLYPRKRRKPAT